MMVLSDCRDLLPQTPIHVLSNGRAFASTEVAAAWAAIQHPNLTVGVPIYSAVDTVHDYVVQAKGAFDETVLGILKLKNRPARRNSRSAARHYSSENCGYKSVAGAESAIRGPRCINGLGKYRVRDCQ
jgi:hypothetical protein